MGTKPFAKATAKQIAVHKLEQQDKGVKRVTRFSKMKKPVISFKSIPKRRAKQGTIESERHGRLESPIDVADGEAEEPNSCEQDHHSQVDQSDTIESIATKTQFHVAASQ